MGTFFLLYLVIAIENIASFFYMLTVFGWVGLVLCGAALFTIGLCWGGPSHSGATFKEYFQPLKKTYNRCVYACIFLIFFGSLGKLLPSQKDMIIIAAGTAAYQAITSDAGKEVSGKAYNALLRKLDSIATETPIVEKLEEPVK